MLTITVCDSDAITGGVDIDVHVALTRAYTNNNEDSKAKKSNNPSSIVFKKFENFSIHS